MTKRRGCTKPCASRTSKRTTRLDNKRCSGLGAGMHDRAVPRCGQLTRLCHALALAAVEQKQTRRSEDGCIFGIGGTELRWSRSGVREGCNWFRPMAAIFFDRRLKEKDPAESPYNGAVWPISPGPRLIHRLGDGQGGSGGGAKLDPLRRPSFPFLVLDTFCQSNRPRSLVVFGSE